jgi:hypothetical protein
VRGRFGRANVCDFAATRLQHLNTATPATEPRRFSATRFHEFDVS